MTIQPFHSFKIHFLNHLYPNQPYRGPIFIGTGLMGLWTGKYIARYIRDNNLNQFAHSNRAIVRTSYRIYNYLFPENSSRRYFMEVALPDNFWIGLQTEIFLQTLPRPLNEPVGSNIEEAILSIARVFFFVYCIDKTRQVVYKTLRSIPHHITWACAIALAPTGVYSITVPNGENFEFRN